MSNKKHHGKRLGGVGIGVTDEGNDSSPIKSFINKSKRIPKERIENEKRCCLFNDICIIDDDFIVGDCNDG